MHIRGFDPEELISEIAENTPLQIMLIIVPLQSGSMNFHLSWKKDIVSKLPKFIDVSAKSCPFDGNHD